MEFNLFHDQKQSTFFLGLNDVNAKKTITHLYYQQCTFHNYIPVYHSVNDKLFYVIHECNHTKYFINTLSCNHCAIQITLCFNGDG